MKNCSNDVKFSKIIGAILLALAVTIAIHTIKQMAQMFSYYNDGTGSGFDFPTYLIIECLTFLIIGIVGLYLLFNQNEKGPNRLAIAGGLGLITLIKSFYSLSECFKALLQYQDGNFTAYLYDGLIYLFVCLICVAYLIRTRLVKEKENQK